jgi:predicted O-methyltransferase YrrM
VTSYRALLESGANGGLTWPDAGLLARIVTARAPTQCLEIGLANGVSSLAILESMPPGGSLVSIDPYQSTEWRGAGIDNIESAGYAARHTLIEEPDYLALPQLVAEGRRFDLVFIDGWHSFDYVMLDAFYADILLQSGGVVGFDDCEMPATRKALRFLTTHRPYEEIRLEASRYRASNPVKTALRFALRWPVQNRWFEKLRDEQTPWNYYHRF